MIAWAFRESQAHAIITSEGDIAVTLTVELEPELIGALRAMAQQAGVDPDRYIARALLEHVQSHQEPSQRGAADEAALLREIRQDLPEARRQRYHDLVAKRRAATLTPPEHQ